LPCQDKHVGYVKWTREVPDAAKPQHNVEFKNLVPDKPSHEKMSMGHQARILGERHEPKSREIDELSLEEGKSSEADKEAKDDSRTYMERTLDSEQLDKETDFDKQRKQRSDDEQLPEGEEKEQEEGERKGEEKEEEQEDEGKTQTWGEVLGQKVQQITDQVCIQGF
jgi:flagellar biosynthesis GTPase FlhF